MCSGDRANGVVLRLTGLPAGTRSIELTATEVSGGIQLDYWQVEADPPPLVLLLEQYRLMQYELYRGWPADPVTDDHILEVLNPATRAVAAEFDSSVLLVDTDGALGQGLHGGPRLLPRRRGPPAAGRARAAPGRAEGARHRLARASLLESPGGQPPGAVCVYISERADGSSAPARTAGNRRPG